MVKVVISTPKFSPGLYKQVFLLWKLIVSIFSYCMYYFVVHKFFEDVFAFFPPRPDDRTQGLVLARQALYH